MVVELSKEGYCVSKVNFRGSVFRSLGKSLCSAPQPQRDVHQLLPMLPMIVKWYKDQNFTLTSPAYSGDEPRIYLRH
jgi:hypothetical protein